MKLLIKAILFGALTWFKWLLILTTGSVSVYCFLAILLPVLHIPIYLGPIIIFLFLTLLAAISETYAKLQLTKRKDGREA